MKICKSEMRSFCLKEYCEVEKGDFTLLKVCFLSVVIFQTSHSLIFYELKVSVSCIVVIFFIIFSCCKTFSMSSSLLFLRRTAPQVASLYIFPPCTAIPSGWNATLAPCRQALGARLPLTSSSPPAVTAGCGHKVCWVNSAGAVYCTVFFSFTWTNKRKR